MQPLAIELVQKLAAHNIKLATAESCTGGMIASAITDISGSSAVLDRGFVTYSNLAKTQMLSINMNLIETHGAVSQEVATAMAEGALKNSIADISISCTGIAGPEGGSAEKPVGLVYIGLAQKNTPAQTSKHLFDGDRNDIRQQTVETALSIILQAVKEQA